MMKNQIEEMVYETPRVRVIEVHVENGFAASPTGDGEGNMDGGGNGWN